VTDWSPGGDLVTTRFDGYWDESVQPKAKEIVLTGVPDQSALTSALITGAVDGTFYVGLGTLNQLKASDSVNVYEGPSYATDALVVSSFDGVLGDVRARQALSLALDRQAMIDATYQGAGLMPRWIANPGTFGYAKDAFEQAYEQSPVLEQDLEKAKALAEEAGIVGKTLHLGTTNELATIATDVAAYQAAAEAIGLKVELRAVSATNYIDFFTNEDAREGLDGFITVDYSTKADPALWLYGIATPEGGSNFSGYDNPKLTELLEKARFTADPQERAQYVIEAQQIAIEELPYIPNVQPTQPAIFHESLTGTTAGFSYMTSPWADNIGGTG
jgi:peptide/nickel transport system substrate-binding protein